MVFLLLLLIAPFLFWMYWRISNRRLLQLASKIPGPKGLPLVGLTVSFIGSPNSIFNNVMSYSEEYHDVVKMWLGPRLFVFLTNPKDIEVLLTSPHIDKAIEYDFMKPWMGNGLLLSTGKKWYADRKAISQTFHVNILRSFMGKFNEKAKAAIKRLDEEIGREFDVRNYLCQFTAETLLATVMGFGADVPACVEYSKNTTRMSTIVHARQLKIYLRPECLFGLSKYGFEQKKVLSVIHGFSNKVIELKKAELIDLNAKTLTVEVTEGETKDTLLRKKIAIETGISFGQSSGLEDDLDSFDTKKKAAFLDALMEKAKCKDGFSYQDVKEQFDTLMFEGHDTTASLSSTFLCMMAIYPQIQDKVVEELDSIFGDSDRDITFQDTLEMKYLERCMMESMRIYSPVPVIARNLKKELKIVTNDIVIPANTTVVVGIYKLHRRSDIYPNPDKFNPDNFLPENCVSRNYYSFIPFSAGLRSCVGRKYAVMKAKTILATILRKYKISTTCQEDAWQFQADITLKRTDGSKIVITPRT